MIRTAPGDYDATFEENFAWLIAKLDPTTFTDSARNTPAPPSI
jgi:hypothetical protein